MFWNRKASVPRLEELVEAEYSQTMLLMLSGLDLCAELAPDASDLWPDLAAALEQGYDLAVRAGSLQRLDALWADPKHRRRAAGACLPRDAASRLMHRALKEDRELTRALYRGLREDAMLVGQEMLPPLNSLSALLVCTSRDRAEAPMLAFLNSLPPCLRAEAALQMCAQLLVGCFAAQFLCMAYARGIAPGSELDAILTNAGREYDLLEPIVHVTYPIYQRYYQQETGGEELNREEYGMMLFFRYRSRMEEPLLRLARSFDPLPPAPGQPVEQWLEDTLRRAITLHHDRLLEMEDAQLNRSLVSLLCWLEPHPDLDTSCGLLTQFADLAGQLKEGSFTCHMDEERSRLLGGDFSEANRTYADSYTLARVANGQEFEDYLARLFAALGYRVTPTGATGDHGVDLILTKNGVRTALQAKFYTGKVGNKAVQEVFSGMSIWGASDAVVVASSSFTPQAAEDAARLGVALVDGQELARLAALAGTAEGLAHRFV